jgi:hypothetical protein
MTREITQLIVEIVRFVDNYQPGIVAGEFVDADGYRHTVIDKVPYFSSEDLDADSKYPQQGAVRCVVLNRWRDSRERELFRVSTDPWGIESTEGLSEFTVLRTQISAVPASGA